MELQLFSTSPPTRLIVVYYPLPSTKNRFIFPLFLEEFIPFLECLVSSSGQLLICGDFNSHIDDNSHSAAVKFIDLLSCFNLNLYNILSPTHTDNHTLDLIITRSDEEFVSNFSVHDPFISDHIAVHCNLSIQRPPDPRIAVCYRKLQAINLDNLEVSPLCLYDQPSYDVIALCDQCYTILSSSLDRHAPLVTKTIVKRPHAPWYDDDIRVQKTRSR